jgi:hypothetical protein
MNRRRVSDRETTARYIFRGGVRARLADLEAMTDFLSDELDATTRDLEQAVDALRTDVGDDLGNHRDDFHGGAS